MSIIIRPIPSGRYLVQIRLGQDVASVVCETFAAALRMVGAV